MGVTATTKNTVHLPFELAQPLLAEKLKLYVEIHDYMDAHNGWFRFPELMLNYLHELGAKHWADLYFQEGRKKWSEEYAQERAIASNAFREWLGDTSDIKRVNAALEEMTGYLTEIVLKDDFSSIPGWEFLNQSLEDIKIDSFTEDELKNQRAVWLGYFVRFFNDLSIATHREPIFSLVERAIQQQDMDAMTKAVQIDRSLLPHFQEQLWREGMKGNQDFFDQLAYRTKNPPKKGVNRHPLLWVLFNDLRIIRCLNRSLSSRKILDFYQSIVGDHPKLSINDDLIVQRQRRQFMKMYRLPK